MSTYHCLQCGCTTDEPDEITESDILQLDAAGAFEFDEGGGIEEAFEHIGEPSCPECGSWQLSEG